MYELKNLKGQVLLYTTDAAVYNQAMIDYLHELKTESENQAAAPAAPADQAPGEEKKISQESI